MKPPTDYRLPSLSDAPQATVVVLRWLTSPGDIIAVGQPLVEVEIDKIAVEILSEVAGTLVEICAHENDEIEVGGLLCRLQAQES